MTFKEVGRAAFVFAEVFTSGTYDADAGVAGHGVDGGADEEVPLTTVWGRVQALMAAPGCGREEEVVLLPAEPRVERSPAHRGERQSTIAAGRCRRIAAGRDRQLVLVVTTAGRRGAILASRIRPPAEPWNGRQGDGMEEVAGMRTRAGRRTSRAGRLVVAVAAVALLAAACTTTNSGGTGRALSRRGRQAAGRA